MSEPSELGPGPLSGLRVIDCGGGLAGMRATSILADLGADVVVIQPPAGDPWRRIAPASAAVFTRRKRAIRLDLRRADAVDQLVDVMASADVVVQSWRPGVAQRLGLDHASLASRAPHLVWCSITGFDGGLSDPAGYESIVHAIVGTTGERHDLRDGPVYQAIPFASAGAAALGVLGTMAALFRRVADGRGRLVETSLLDGALAYLSMLWGDSDSAAERAQPVSGGRRLLSRVFLCSDDEYIGIHTGARGGFGRLLAVVGLSDRIADGGPGDGLSPRESAVLAEELPRIVASRTRQEWFDALIEADVCAIPVMRPTECFADPQVVHNNAIVTVDDPDLGELEQVGPPATYVGVAPVEHFRPLQRIDDLADVGRAWSAPSPFRPAGSSGPAAPDRPLLDGLRVVDLGVWYASGYASRLLADLGADVIKIEPLAGDQMRGMLMPFRSAYAGKRAVALDLTDEDARRVAYDLVATADAVHHNLRPGVAERLGVDYDSLSEVNPELVYLHAPGWGSSGPRRHHQSFAPHLSNFVGAAYEVAGQFNPPLYSIGNEDPAAGMIGAISVLVSLLNRDLGRPGRFIEIPQVNVALTHVAHIPRRVADDRVLGAVRLDPLQMGLHALDSLYRTADGWISIAAYSDDEVASLGAVTGIALLDDPRFAQPTDRYRHDDDLRSLLADTFRTRPTEAWVDALRACGVAAVGPVTGNNSAPFLRDPANRATGRVAEVDHPTAGRVRESAILVRVGGATAAQHRVAPMLGEHTDEVLRELGVDDNTLARLRDKRAIA